MGKRDHWPYYRDYWAKWTEHNRNAWNNAYAHRYANYLGRSRMLGKVIFFGLGFWAGSFMNQRYRMPSAHPREAWFEMRSAAENLKKEQPDSADSSELREIIEKVKALETRYRRSQPTDGSQPSGSGSSGSGLTGSGSSGSTPSE